MKPIPKKPRSIIAQVEGSGTLPVTQPDMIWPLIGFDLDRVAAFVIGAINPQIANARALHRG
jgi:hypothetical protein